MISKKTLFSLATTLGGMPVLSTLPSSPAARAGVRYGDVVLSVNGRRTPSVDEYVQAAMSRRDGMTVVIFRDGRERTIELIYERNGDPLADLESVIEGIAERRAVSELPAPPPEDEESND